MKNIKNIIIFIILILSFTFIIFIVGFGIYSKFKTNNIYNIQNANVLNNFNDIYSSDIPKDSIYTTIFVDPASEIDLSNIKDIYNNADLVIIGTIIEKNDGIMFEDYGYACIPGKVCVDTVLKGNLSTNEINIFSNGGYCTVKDYINTMSNTKKEKIEKMGLNNLSDKDKKEKYIVFNYKYGKNFYKNKRYIIMLKNNNGRLISMSNYGFIEVQPEENISSLSDIINIIN